MSAIELHEGDNRDSLRRLIDAGVRVHSVVTDPPYGLTSITKRFGKDGAAPALSNGATGVFGRASTGFMGQQWDGTGIERDPEFWRLIWEILLPGGYVVAFSGSRTGHWQACAMEQAGFVMHPMKGWVTGQGFPKAHNAARAIEKALGVDDAPEAAQWEGWAYGTQAFKPAMEPIYLAQKPFSEKNGAFNILKHGVGALNVDGCRVPGGEVRPLVQSDRRSGNNTYSDGLQGSRSVGETTLGRHPANLLHDGSPEVLAMFPNDNARFFNCFPSDSDPLFYHPKATKADRAGSRHPTVKPIKLMEWLVTMVTPPGGTVLDPFAGSGTTGQAARNLGRDCILMEAEPQYITDIRGRFGLLHDDFADLLG